MTSPILSGRDGIALLKKALGIEQTGIRELRIIASYKDAVQVEIDTFGKVESVDVTTDDEPTTQRFIVEVRRLV